MRAFTLTLALYALGLTLGALAMILTASLL